jgi:hypothetical protein
MERPSSSVPSGCATEERSSDLERFGADGLLGKITGASSAVMRYIRIKMPPKRAALLRLSFAQLRLS